MKKLDVNRKFYWRSEVERAKMQILAEVGMGVRTLNCLANEGILDIDLLCTKTEKDLMRIPNFGRMSLFEVISALGFLGRRLQTQPVVDPKPSVDPKDVRIARLEYALLRIADEAYRENGSWVHLKRCIAVQAKEALGDEVFNAARNRALTSGT